MAPQRIHELPGGGRVTVVDTGSAAEHLGTMLQRFRDGDSEPLIFSDSGTGEPEGVVISFSQWLAFLQAEDDAASARVQEVTRQRIANTPAEDYIPLDRSRRKILSDQQHDQPDG